MLYIDSRSIGNISSTTSLSAGTFATIKSIKKSRITRSRKRKILIKKHRKFVDNVIMHHKRIHDRNSRRIVNLTKSKSPILKKTINKGHTDIIRDNILSRSDSFLKQDSIASMREKIEARRIRTKSRWAGMLKNDSFSDYNIKNCTKLK